MDPGTAVTDIAGPIMSSALRSFRLYAAPPGDVTEAVFFAEGECERRARASEAGAGM